ncbi:17132_t:CDS:2, partial [Cetraspora pellucida]
NSSNVFTLQIDSSNNTFFSQVDSSIEEIDLFSEQKDILKDNTNKNFNNKYYGNNDSPLYGLDEVQKIITKKFQKAESNSKNVNFDLEIELNQQLFENISCSNQVLLAKLYLEQPKFITKGFKILNFIENDFVKALSFTTPLLSYIGATNITEIVINSTFKTNKEQFELFTVNTNYDGYELPLAYLYLLTLNSNKEALDNPKNKIKTCVQVL